MHSLSSRKEPSTDGLSRDECGSCRVSGVFIGEALESVGFFSFVRFCIVAGDEVVKVGALELLINAAALPLRADIISLCRSCSIPKTSRLPFRACAFALSSFH